MRSAGPPPGGNIRVATAVPNPTIYQGTSMQDRRDFMAEEHAVYLAACNVLIAQGVNIVPLPISALIHIKTKRRIARFELTPDQVTEEMCTEYFKQALVPSHIDFTTVDEAMRQRLRMNTRMAEPESRMTKLQADLEAILDEFNLAEFACRHEEKKIVQYLTNALAPQAFKDRVVSELSRAQNKRYRDHVFDYCVGRWPTKGIHAVGTSRPATADARTRWPWRSRCWRCYWRWPWRWWWPR
jgi:hypothetical protein